MAQRTHPNETFLLETDVLEVAVEAEKLSKQHVAALREQLERLGVGLVV